MAVKVYIEVGTTTYDLSSYETYLHLGNDGWGIPEVTRYQQSGPMQNGATNAGFRLQARTLVLSIGFATETIAEYFERRKELFFIFKPRNVPIRLRIDIDGIVRQLDVFYVKGLEANSSDKIGLFHRFAIILNAPEPTWYDPDGVSIPFGTVSPNAFTVPMTVPTGVGSPSIDQTVSILYMGSWDSYPTIRITGPVTDCVIQNITTGDKLDFTGYTIAGGTTVTIDTRYGFKTVTDQNGTNLIDKLTADSNLATFRLISSDTAEDGQTNDIEVTGSGATTASRIFLLYTNRYLAI